MCKTLFGAKIASIEIQMTGNVIVVMLSNGNCQGPITGSVLTESRKTNSHKERNLLNLILFLRKERYMQIRQVTGKLQAS